MPSARRINYLALLSISSYFPEDKVLILKPLADVYRALNENGKKEIQEVDDLIKNTPDEVIDDETQETKHDFYRYRIEEVQYEQDLQVSAVSASLIIVAQSYLHSKFQNVVSAHKYYLSNEKVDKLRAHYFSLGERVGEEGKKVSWAEAVKSASNYVRHYEEWDIKHMERDRNTGVVTRLTNLISQLSDKFRGTPQILLDLGFSEEQIFKKNENLCAEIVEKLKLNDPEEFSRLAAVWVEAVEDDLYQKFEPQRNRKR